ncbi:hypothetical protein PJP10_31625, partial [Mycobacterium kansasii]
MIGIGPIFLFLNLLSLKLSEDSRRSLVKALTDENVRQVLMVELEKDEQRDCLPIISFSDEDLVCDGEHNRPLMV